MYDVESSQQAVAESGPEVERLPDAEQLLAQASELRQRAYDAMKDPRSAGNVDTVRNVDHWLRDANSRESAALTTYRVRAEMAVLQQEQQESDEATDQRFDAVVAGEPAHTPRTAEL